MNQDTPKGLRQTSGCDMKYWFFGEMPSWLCSLNKDFNLDAILVGSERRRTKGKRKRRKMKGGLAATNQPHVEEEESKRSKRFKELWVPIQSFMFIHELVHLINCEKRGADQSMRVKLINLFAEHLLIRSRVHTQAAPGPQWSSEALHMLMVRDKRRLRDQIDGETQHHRC